MRVDIPAKLRNNTFYKLTILSPTYSPQEVYGSPGYAKTGVGGRGDHD